MSILTQTYHSWIYHQHSRGRMTRRKASWIKLVRVRKLSLRMSKDPGESALQRIFGEFVEMGRDRSAAVQCFRVLRPRPCRRHDQFPALVWPRLGVMEHAREVCHLCSVIPALALLLMAPPGPRVGFLRHRQGVTSYRRGQGSRRFAASPQRR